MIDPRRSAPPPISRRTIVWLIAILCVGLAVRLFFVATTSDGGQPAVIDVDGYLARAEHLAGRGQGWHWDIRAVEYRMSLKAPLYSVLLSLIAVASPFTWHGTLGVISHVLAGVLSAGLLFWIGRTVHSDRAGLIAAGIYAIWHPDVTAVTTFLQEQYWIPFTLAGFGFFLSATVRDGPERSFALAGVMFGLAALVRSMQVYYLPIALLLYLGIERGRRPAWRHAAVLLCAFLITVGPYIVFISSRVGQVVLIDTQGAYLVRYRDRAQGPSVAQSAGVLIGRLASNPRQFIAARAPLIVALVQLRGGRWLETDGLVASRARAWVLKVVTHLTNDLLYIVAILAAPIGLVVARRSREASILALWIVLNIGLMNLLLWSGARYRQAFAPEMIVLAAVALSGQWRRPSRLAGLAAVATSLVAAVLVLSSVPQTLRGRAEYGVGRWSIRKDLRDTRAFTPAGFHVVPKAGWLTFSMRGRGAPRDVLISLNQRPADQVHLEGRKRVDLDYPWPQGGIVYVELDSPAATPGDRRPIMIATTSIAR